MTVAGEAGRTSRNSSKPASIVHVSTDTQVRAVLQVGSQSQTVTVQADAIQVQTTSAAVGEVVSGTQVRELPLNGENFVGLTQLSPGVSAAQSV